MMKKTLLCALLLCLACVCLTSMGSAELSGACGPEVEWVLDDAGLLTISGTGDITLSFSEWDSIKEVVIQNGVTGIGEWAFGKCPNLTRVQIPDSVAFIASSAFYGCENLPAIVIPDSVTRIGEWAFGNCSALADVTLPDSALSIGSYAFYACGNLSEIRIPDSVVSVGEYAFAGCPVPIASIGSNGAKVVSKAGLNFQDAACPQLELRYIDQSDGKTALYVVWADPSAVSLTIPEGVNGIDDGIFAYSENLTNISLPDSLTAIGEGAFYSCVNLPSIQIPDGVTFVGGYAFSGGTAVPTASVGSGGAKALSQAGFSFRDTKYPDINLQYIAGDDARVYLAVTGADESLTSVTVPQGVTMVGDWAFAQNPNLISVSLPDGLMVIGECAFYESENLSNVSLPDSVVSIGGYAFCGCKKLAGLNIPDGVAWVGEHAFANCPAVLTASIGSGGAKALSQAGFSFRDASAPQIGLKYLYEDGALTGLAVTGADESATSVTVPQGVTRIEEGAFGRNPSLASVSLPDGLKTIGYGAFYECGNLSSVTLPDSVVSIDGYAFCKCRKLAGLNIPDGVTTIGENAFANGPALLTASVGSAGAKTLGKADLSFRDPNYPQIDLKYIYQGDTLTGLAIVGADESAASVTIPDSVVAIADEVFKNCGSLSTLSIPDSVTYIGEMAFPATTTLYVSRDSYAHQYALNNGIPYVIRGEEEKPQPGTAQTVAEKVAEIVAEVIKPGMTDYQKALVLHNYLIYHANYSLENGEAEGVLLEGKGHCQSYTDAYALLLDAVGIQNWKEYGTEHIWNVAKLDGSWCHIDVTWDDPDTEEALGAGGFENCSFFAVTDFALEGVASHERFNRTTVCDDYKISYAYKSGALRSIVNEWKRQINEKLENGEYEIVIENTFANKLNDHMAYQMLCDEQFFIDGRLVAAELGFSSDYSANTYQLRVKFNPEATQAPTVEPTAEPTAEPTVEPTVEPSAEPSVEPSVEPTAEPTVEPTAEPTVEPTMEPTAEPTDEPTVLAGDTNGDGVVDGRDLLRLARFIAGQDVQIDEKAADMNNDGQVDGRDVLRLAKRLAGY